MQCSRLVRIGLALLACLSVPAAFAEQLILLRDDPPSGERLVVELREVGMTRLDVPYIEEGKTGTKLEEYPFLATVTLFREGGADNPGGKTLRGHMAFAADTETRSWETLMDEARETLTNLGSESLDQPLAFGRPDALSPLPPRALSELETPKPTLTCARGEDENASVVFYQKREMTLPDGTQAMAGTVGSLPPGDEVETLCRQMFDAASQTLPETFYSRYRVTSRRTLRVTLESRGEIPETATRGELFPRPDAIEEHILLEADEGAGERGSYKSMKVLDGGAGIEARMSLPDGTELFSVARDMTLEADALDYPALLHRWRVTHEERPLGLMPNPPAMREEAVVGVIIPLPRPLDLEQRARIDFVADDSEVFAFSPDVDALIERVGEILLRSEDVDAETVMDAYYSAYHALTTNHMLIALCPENAEDAQYLMLPTGSLETLVESDGFCREAFERFQ